MAFFTRTDREAAIQIFLLLILFGLMHAARSFAPQPGLGSGAAGTTLAAGFLLLAALFAGNLLSQLHLPRLTGYLLIGMLVGPHIMDLVTEQMLRQLRIFNGVAIALIALTAGTEMDLRRMRPLLRGIAWITTIAVLGSVLLLGASVYLLRDLLPFTAGLGEIQILAIAILLGAALAAQSPAVVVALRKETEADGPVSRTVLGVVVVSDIVVILLFALTSFLARALLDEGSPGALSGGLLVWEVLGSGIAGVLIGILVAAFLRSVEGGGLFVVAVGFLVAEVGQRIHMDPLLVALSAGLFIRNVTAYGDRLHAEIEAASLPVYIAFFAVAGATIDLTALAAVGIPAALFSLIRAAGFLGGTRIAARVARAPGAVGRYAGFGLLPQAGLAIALALLLARTYPQFGPEASALVLGVVALNQIFGPIVYRWALVRSGEAGRLPEPAASPTPAAEDEPIPAPES